MKRCAYCDRTDVKFTAEHVVSKGFLNRYYKAAVGYAKVYDNYTSNFLTINDVCVACNNGILSVLDNYFLEFYAANIPEEMIDSGSTVSITYDFDKLSKWLLKTLYNSERKHPQSNIPMKLSRYRNYILGREKRQKLLKIYVELLQDVPYEEIEQYVEDKSGFPKKLAYLRMGTVVFSDEMETGIKHLIKHFTTSNFIFHVFVLDSGQHKEKAFSQVLKKYLDQSEITRLVYLDPDKTRIELRASERTIVDILLRVIEGNGPVFAKLRK